MATKIEWTDETWNPVTGCTKVSQGCKNCYAERIWPKVEAAERQREHWEWMKAPKRAFTDVRTHPNRLEAPLHWKKPRRIFVNSMSDLFHEDVPDEFIDQVFGVMLRAEQHTFQVLTKRPQRMLDYCANGGGDHLENAIMDGDWPLSNVWLGVSVEDQQTADERIPLLLKTPATVRFLSCEPLLGTISIDSRFVTHPDDGLPVTLVNRINWVIAGGESGPNARPSHPDWFRSLRDQCAAAGVPYFFKQWGEWVAGETEVLAEPPGRVVYTDDESIQLVDGRRYSTIEAHGKEFIKVGKKAAGRMLDGREHMEWPAC